MELYSDLRDQNCAKVDQKMTQMIAMSYGEVFIIAIVVAAFKK